MILPRQRINPCLWFNDQAVPAATRYCAIFPNSRILSVVAYTEAGREHHPFKPGDPMTVSFELDGQPFVALNGGPIFSFTEAISLQVLCEDQAEIDHYWMALSEGGDPQAQVCGWLKDRFGLSWQVTPRALLEMLADPDPARATRVAEAMFQMQKFDLAALRRAHAARG
ncbi:MAG: VOC family protein [Thermoflexales bacterium]|nr:VOC family protein [Thermoflexales bacterium]